MDSERLTADQQAQLLAWITRDAVYYYRLKRRMERMKWRRDDPVFIRVELAAKRLRDLRFYIAQVHVAMGPAPFDK